MPWAGPAMRWTHSGHVFFRGSWTWCMCVVCWVTLKSCRVNCSKEQDLSNEGILNLILILCLGCATWRHDRNSLGSDLSCVKEGILSDMSKKKCSFNFSIIFPHFHDCKWHVCELDSLYRTFSFPSPVWRWPIISHFIINYALLQRRQNKHLRSIPFWILKCSWLQQVHLPCGFKKSDFKGWGPSYGV